MSTIIEPDLDCDVVIAGAGMAGATLALALDQAGLKTILVDVAAVLDQLEPSFDGRASAIAYSALRQWRALGLAEALEGVAQPIRRIVVTDGHAPGPGGGAAVTGRMCIQASDIEDAHRDEPLGWMLENRHIRMALDAALTRSNVTCLRPASIAAVQFETNRIEARLEDGRRVTARLAIGSEGRKSPLRVAAGLGANGWSYGQTGVVATVQLDRPHDGTAWQHFMPSGPLAILPLTHDRASLVWTERTSRAEALVTISDAAFESLLRRRFSDDIGQPSLIGARFAYPLSLQLSHSSTAKRLALVGDSAHGVHPISGQGLNLGLKDVAALAQVLSDAAKLGEDIGSPLVLDRYARWRRFDTAGSMLASDLFAKSFSNNNPLMRLARDAGLDAVNAMAPLRRLLAREAGGVTGDAPGLLLGQPLDEAAPPG